MQPTYSSHTNILSWFIKPIKRRGVLLLCVPFILCGVLHAQQGRKGQFVVKKQVQKAFVSADKMNVFYVGVDNPVTVSVPGVSVNDVTVSINGGTILGTEGEYVVHVKIPGQWVRITVYSKTPSGGKINRGTTEFRTKSIPSPVCYMANTYGDCSISTAELQVCQTVQARMEDFDFNVAWSVTSFDMVIITQNGSSTTLSSNSCVITPEQKQALSAVSPGDRIIIQNVHISGPDNRIIQGMNITVTQANSGDKIYDENGNVIK